MGSKSVITPPPPLTCSHAYPHDRQLRQVLQAGRCCRCYIFRCLAVRRHGDAAAAAAVLANRSSALLSLATGYRFAVGAGTVSRGMGAIRPCCVSGVFGSSSADATFVVSSTSDVQTARTLVSPSSFSSPPLIKLKYLKIYTPPHENNS